MEIATPGFADKVSDAQQTFRAVLNAMAHPGQIQTVDANLQPPDGFSQAMAAVCLTLLDLDVQVWLQPEISHACRDWLVFHTGCRLSEDPGQADFAVVCDRQLDLTAFNPGTPEYPEASTTILLQLESLLRGEQVAFQGPGIQTEIPVTLPVSSQFWQQWQQNHQRYPLGTDVFCLAGNQILGLPRSVRAVAS